MRRRAIACLAGVLLCAGCGGAAGGGASGAPARTSSTLPVTGGTFDYGPVNNAMLDDFFYQSTQGGAESLSNRLDFGSVSDRELLDAGVAFCTQLSARGAHLTPADFDAVAVELSARFKGRLVTPSGEPAPDGPLLLMSAVGASAVRRFCPAQSAALPLGFQLTS